MSHFEIWPLHGNSALHALRDIYLIPEAPVPFLSNESCLGRSMSFEAVRKRFSQGVTMTFPLHWAISFPICHC